MNAITTHVTTLDDMDAFLERLTKAPHLTTQERIAAGQMRNALADLLEKLDVPYAAVALDLTGHITSYEDATYLEAISEGE